METFFDPVLKLVGFTRGSVSRQIRYARDLDRKATDLWRKADELRHRHADIQAQVRDAVSVGKTNVPQVENWLEDVEGILRDVASIESDFRQGGRCFNGRCPDLCWRIKLGKKIEKKTKVVEQLQTAVLDKVAESPRRPLMPEFQVPSQIEQQSTSQETMQEIEQALSDEGIGIVSVCGMGGIGKTTLMQKIYNRLCETRNFDLVLWVTVSKDLDLNVIQQKIGNKLGVQFCENDGREEKRDKLYPRLMNVRYMLILDDLWKKFSLDHIGIPQPDRENRCKIAITTRSVEVGNGMDADRVIKVRTLSSGEAWELFRSKTGDVVLQSEIQTLARKVVRECAGLPLAIKTVGGAMRQKGRKELWQNALRALRAPEAPEVPGMEREVFLPLKLSYDCLEECEIQSIQSCFLYCSLFPEDHEIFVSDLVRYWAFEEGLINNVSSLEDAINKGYGIIERLRDACLLEGDVRMHDLLRDLAIWITSSSSSVKAGEGLEQPPEEKMWEGTQRISLMCNHITELQMTPNCPDLVYLSLSDNYPLHTIHNSFFEHMPKLQILDLKRTHIKSLPPSLSQLVNLRVLDASQCSNLQDLPPLGHLKELQFLDLGSTGIESLPQGIERLAKLRSLELSLTKAPATIPRGIISRLTSLEDLGLYSDGQMMSMEIWREVATLPRLTNLRTILPSLDAFSATDMEYPMWSRLSRFLLQFGHTAESYFSTYLVRLLFISDCEELPIQINGLMEKAEEITIQQCKSLGFLSQNTGDSTSMREAGLNNAFDGGPSLKRISISGCHKARCIFSSCVFQHLQSLESLAVEDGEEIVEIVEGGPLPDTALQRLRRLSLKNLSKLDRISISACQISISGCHKLRCIFSSSMLQHLQSLERLSVSDCEEIVEIVEGGPLPDTSLQRLVYLSLHKLPKLERISLFACEISISGCPKLRCIFSSSMLQNLQSLESLRVSDCEELVEIVEGGPLPDMVTSPQLKSISISGCHKSRCIFSSSMLQHLQSLESLEVEHCEEIVEGGPLPDTAILPKLKSISISGRHKLRCIFSSSMLQHLQSLESLTVSNCEEIVEFVEGGALILPQLKSVCISGCHKSRCIFSSTMLQQLQSLESLRVSDCEEIVEIVEGGPLPDTALQSLTELNLYNLPKLMAICSQQLVLTSMKEIGMYDCPELKKLPVLCSGIQEIRGWISASREWWEGIEWEDEHSKSLYSTIYKERRDHTRGDDVEEA